MSKKVTYKDISDRTGVSLATISRIVKGTAMVSSETNRKVVEAMKEMGYALPLSVEAKNHPIIMMQLPSVSNPFYSDIIRGIETIARGSGYRVVIHEGELNESMVDDLLQIIKKAHVAGLICMNNIPPSLIPKLKGAVPVVQCSERSDRGGIPFVSIDSVASAYKAIQLLVSHNDKKISFVNGPHIYQYAVDRRKGAVQALSDANLEMNPRFFLELSDIDFDLALSAVSQLFAQPDRPDAVFTASDVIAAAVLKAAHQAHLRIPEDVEVVGFDNINIARICIPSITTVSQPCYRLGLTSCEMLIKVMEHGYDAVQSVLLDTEIVMRESTR